MSTEAERKVYNSARWRKVRAIAIGNAKGLCVLCKASGEIKPGAEVDHIIPIKERPDLMYVTSNLQYLCHDCHTLKTAADARPTPRFCEHGNPAPSCLRCAAA